MAKHIFQPGNKFGKGRPPGGHSEWAKEVMEREGRKYILKWMRSTNNVASMAALTLLMAYAYGRPTEKHEVSGTINIENLIPPLEPISLETTSNPSAN